MHKNQNRLLSLLFVLVAVAATTACKEAQPCDEGYELKGSTCSKSAPPPRTDAASPTDTTVGDMMSSTMTGASKFGVTCAATADCTGDTDYCLKGQPGKDPYCTKSGCDKGATCPTGWTCFDLSPLAPGQPFVCYH